MKRTITIYYKTVKKNIIINIIKRVDFFFKI